MYRFLLCFLLLSFPLSAAAATLTRTGALDVDLGGTLYDVEFVADTCANTFSGCAPSTTSILDEVTAFRAAFALKNLIDATPDIDANLTITGCSELSPRSVCSILMPYVAAFNPGVVSYISLENWEAIDDDADGYTAFCCLPPDRDTSRNDVETFARWTLSSERPQPGGIVPLPASALLMLSALAGMGGFLRLRRS